MPRQTPQANEVQHEQSHHRLHGVFRFDAFDPLSVVVLVRRCVTTMGTRGAASNWLTHSACAAGMRINLTASTLNFVPSFPMSDLIGSQGVQIRLLHVDN